MKSISEFIISGVNTKVYYVSLGSFDTHFNQQKRQGELLQQLSETVKIFMDDLKKNGKANDVLLMTFSEFGENVSKPIGAVLTNDKGVAVLSVPLSNLSTQNGPWSFKAAFEGNKKIDSGFFKNCWY